MKKTTVAILATVAAIAAGGLIAFQFDPVKDWVKDKFESHESIVDSIEDSTEELTTTEETTSTEEIRELKTLKIDTDYLKSIETEKTTMNGSQMIKASIEVEDRILSVEANVWTKDGEEIYGYGTNSYKLCVVSFNKALSIKKLIAPSYSTAVLERDYDTNRVEENGYITWDFSQTEEQQCGFKKLNQDAVSSSFSTPIDITIVY